MIFDCPSCGAENGIPVSVIGEEGHLLRCRRCAGTFRVFPPDDEEDTGAEDGEPPASRPEDTTVAVPNMSKEPWSAAPQSGPEVPTLGELETKRAPNAADWRAGLGGPGGEEDAPVDDETRHDDDTGERPMPPMPAEEGLDPELDDTSLLAKRESSLPAKLPRVFEGSDGSVPVSRPVLPRPPTPPDPSRPGLLGGTPVGGPRYGLSEATEQEQGVTPEDMGLHAGALGMASAVHRASPAPPLAPPPSSRSDVRSFRPGASPLAQLAAMETRDPSGARINGRDRTEPEIQDDAPQQGEDPASNPRAQAAVGAIPEPAFEAMAPSVVLDRGIGAVIAPAMRSARETAQRVNRLPLALKAALFVFPIVFGVTLLVRSPKSTPEIPIPIAPAAALKTEALEAKDPSASKTATVSAAAAQPPARPATPVAPPPPAENRIPGLPTDVPAPDGWAYVASPGAKLRARPNKDGAIVGKLPAGRLVRTFGEAGDWTLLHVPPDGPAGFVKRELLEMKKPIEALARDVAFADCIAEERAASECISAADDQLTACLDRCGSGSPGDERIERCDAACKAAFVTCRDECARNGKKKGKKKKR